MDNNQAPVTTQPNISPEKPKVTADIVKATFQLELSKLKYQEALAALVAYEVTRENVAEAQTKLKEARKMLTVFDDIKKKGKAEAWAICNWWDDAYNGTKESFESELSVKSKEVTKIANQLAEESQKAEAEKQRVKGIKDSIDNFFIAQSQAIAAATTTEELVRVEKLIGSHRRASRYDGFFDLMDAKAANLADLIKSQKIALKELEGLKQAEIAAEANGDDQEVLDNRDAQEAILQKIHENKEIVQSKAIHMATEAEVIEAEVIIPAAPKARLTKWCWEMTDEKAATKAGLILVIPNKEKIDELLKAKREKEIEVTENGIRYFIQTKY